MRTWPALEIAPPDDLVQAALTDFDVAAIDDNVPDAWRVFFQTSDGRDRAAAALHEQFPNLTIARVDVPDEDWAARSQASLTAVRVGGIVVAPPWDIPAAGVTIVIQPSMGFGTGHHATTRLCLQLLDAIDVSDRTVLDLGTGSGVLAMAAALRGARSVVGVDVDQDAINSAEASARVNILPDTITFTIGDFRRDPPAPADVVLANLTGGMLTSSAAAIARVVRPGGQLIVSGFDGSEMEAVAAAFAAFGERERLTDEGWVALRLG